MNFLRHMVLIKTQTDIDSLPTDTFFPTAFLLDFALFFFRLLCLYFLRLLTTGYVEGIYSNLFRSFLQLSGHE